MSDLKFFGRRLARYVLVREVVARIVAELNCTEAEAALALSGLLVDLGNRAPSWFDIQEIEAGGLIKPFDASELNFMLLQLQLPDPEYDPRLTRDEIWNLWGGAEGGKGNFLAEHRGVQFFYSFACFLRGEIEPILRDAELLTGAMKPPAKPSVTASKRRDKLTEAQIQELVERSSKGDKTRAKLAVELAEKFGVSRQAVRKRLDKLDETAAPLPMRLWRTATKY